ncbi:hypothetical protein NJ7G_3383 [Natrinema sp. J7-2]|nr:hypothetical protein NJ7G_3383 [Natrinema sp. J7-2]
MIDTRVPTSLSSRANVFAPVVVGATADGPQGDQQQNRNG